MTEFTTSWLASEHERLGPAVMEIVRSYVRSLDDAAVCSPGLPADLDARFDAPLPTIGCSPAELFEIIERDVVPHVTNISSPRYFGLFNPTPLPIGVWVDALVSALNQNAASWRNAPVATVLEARVLRWLCELLGYPPTGSGTLTSGGSEANLVGLKCARDRAADGARSAGLAVTGASGPLTIYASEQCHYSLVRSADVLGVGRSNLRKIATDGRYHIRVDALRAAIDRDLSAGCRPCCVVGVAGATSSGVIDPLDELADVAAEYGLWFHVDAAYGGALAFSTRHRGRLAGIERADSVTIDPHKWMFVPFACGALLVRDGADVLRDAFDITPEYLNERRDHAEDERFDYFRLGQLGTRRGSALTVWATLRAMGTDGYAAVIDRQLELTHHLAARLDELDDFERLGEIETAVCCARYLPPALRSAPPHAQDELQRTLQQRIELSGRAWLATTELHGRRALRFNIDSFLTDQHHIDELVAALRQQAHDLRHGASPNAGFAAGGGR